MIRSPLVWGVIALTLMLASCAQERSERERLAEARVLIANGDFIQARAVFESVALSSPNDPEVRTRYASFLIERGELDSAGRQLEGATGLEMTQVQRERWNDERDAYWTAVLTLSRGEDLARPSDRGRYEEALLGLIDVHDGGTAVFEYHDYWEARARMAIGGQPEADLVELNDSERLRRVTPGQAAEGIQSLDRLLEGDPGWESPRPPSRERIEAATTLREGLRRRLFADRFHREWRRQHEFEMVAAGRFDPAREEFLFHYQGPAPDGADADSPQSRLSWLAQTYIARDHVGVIAAELRGVAVPLEPLPFEVEDFAEVSVTGARLTETGFEAHLRVPFSVVEMAAYLLDRASQSS